MRLGSTVFENLTGIRDFVIVKGEIVDQTG